MSEYKNAKYRGWPCWYDPIDSEIIGKNWFYSIMIDINIWLDVEIFQVEAFPIEIEDEDEEDSNSTH